MVFNVEGSQGLKVQYKTSGALFFFFFFFFWGGGGGGGRKEKKKRPLDFKFLFSSSWQLPVGQNVS